MGPRAVVLAAVVALAAACETTERIEIHPDGSATVNVAVEVAPDDSVFDLFPFAVDYDEWSSLALADPSEFLEEALALESMNSTLADELSVDVGADSTTIAWRRDVDDAHELTTLLADERAFVALADAVIVESADEISLRADGAENLSSYWQEFLGVEQTEVFESGVLDNQLTFDGTQTVELVLPGRIVAHDAHDVDGDTLRWSWTIGEPARPGISATWDPLGEPDRGFDWWGRDQLIVYGFVLFGLVVLVLAGSMGFLGFTRKLEKEGRRAASGRWPRRR